MAFKDLQRPVKGDNDIYQCPEGFQACNEAFFEQGGEGDDYVICYPSSANACQFCPVTGFALEVDHLSNKDLYEWQPINSLIENDDRGFYISKTVMQHGVDQLKVQPGQPC